MRIALAQIAPKLGDVKANLAKHMEYIARAREAGADVLCFPELSLTGYYLRDLTTTVAVRPTGDDPIFAQLLAASQDVDIVVGFVEETPRYLYYNSAAYLSAGQVLHVHRKVYLPTYGMFDESRFLAEGDQIRAFDTRHGRVAVLICEDLWHLPTAYLAWLDGADYILTLVSSPGRGVRPEDETLGSAQAWDLLTRTLAQFLTCYVTITNRVGFEDGVGFFGGSLIVQPGGTIVVQAPLLDEALVVGECDTVTVRRERIRTPLLRDEKPLVVLQELQRLLAHDHRR
jgi:predicted amidohydrolase